MLGCNMGTQCYTKHGSVRYMPLYATVGVGLVAGTLFLLVRFGQQTYRVTKWQNSHVANFETSQFTLCRVKMKKTIEVGWSTCQNLKRTCVKRHTGEDKLESLPLTWSTCQSLDQINNPQNNITSFLVQWPIIELVAAERRNPDGAAGLCSVEIPDSVAGSLMLDPSIQQWISCCQRIPRGVAVVLAAVFSWLMVDLSQLGESLWYALLDLHSDLFSKIYHTFV